MTVVYKIRRRKDGLFSTGGMTPSFSKNGKVWNTIGYLKRHLTGIANQGRWVPENEKAELRKRRILVTYPDCEIVEYERIEQEGQLISVFLGMG